MDGFKSAEKILSFHTDMKNTRGLRSLVQDLHIFAISSYVNTDTVQKAKEVGFLKIFQKPIGMQQLGEMIGVKQIKTNFDENSDGDIDYELPFRSEEE